VIPIELEFVERQELLGWCKKYRDDIFKPSASVEH
jgi:hypothetical protein